MSTKLVPPRNGFSIDFKPSERQYEVWKALQPECPVCGGTVTHIQNGVDRNGNPTYKPVCTQCGTDDIPQIILEGGAAGGGKAGLLDSNVLTPFGFRKLRDIKMGDIITSPTTGGMQKVVYLHPIGKFDFYRVKFRDGTYFDCSEGHLWTLHESRKHKSKKVQKYGLSTDTVWSTIQMYEWYQKKNAGMYKGSHLIIPLPEPVKFTFGNKGNSFIDPYVFGAIVGDGCIANSCLDRGYVEFTTIDQEIVDRFVKAGYDMSRCYDKPHTEAKAYKIYDAHLIEILKKLCVAGNKSQTHFLPKCYLYASVEDRIKLMQGLMDTDGYVDDRGHMSYTSTSKQLAEDVAFVVRSLGGVATITSDIGTYKNQYGERQVCSEAYTVYFRTKMDPDLCGLTRKKVRAKYEFNGGVSEYGKRIVDIEYLGKKEGRCISVSEPEGLYIVDDFTVTHNSFLGSAWLISSCIRWSNIRAGVGRKTLKSLRESTWNTICTIMKDWGLVEGENYKINNIAGEITFWNDSKIIMKELCYQPSDPQYLRFGSSEYSCFFIDEAAELDEKAVDVLFSRIRWHIPQTTVVPKLLMSTNPSLGWIRSRFVMDDDGNDVVCRKYERYIPYSVYDNPDAEFRRQYLNSLLRISDPATRERLLYGNWRFVDSNEMAAYWNFDGEKHLVDGLRERVYNPLKPIISGWDFNVAPYMSELEFQIDYEKKKLYILEENIGKPENKENNTPMLAKRIMQQKLDAQHVGGMIITGDPAGQARSTQTEDGINNYTIIQKNMKNTILAPRIKLLQKQPPMVTRLEFVNAIFNGYDGWKVEIDMRCRKLTEDMVYQQKNSDGTKCKKKVTNPKTNTKEEKYGHLSDILDYVFVLFLNESWLRFQNQRTTIETYTATVYNQFDY